MQENVIKFNQEDYPIVVVYTDYKDLNESQVEKYLNQMTEFYQKNISKGVVIIYDISILRAVSAKGRIRVGEWLRENTELIKSAVAGVCYVQNSVFQKVILEGIFAVKKPEWPHKVVKSVSEGKEWAKVLLELK
jgi:hypothetical protein